MSCQLYIHAQESRLPEGSDLAWSLHRRLSSPSVQRYGLQTLAVQALSVTLDQEELDETLDLMDGIVMGLTDAGEELAKENKGDGKDNRNSPRGRR